MKFLSSGVFWGLLLITIGVLAILRTVLNINVPLFRVAVALFFIYIGLSILFGGFGVTGDKNLILFEERSVAAVAGSEQYTIVFANGTVDLSGINIDDAGELQVSTVFGAGRILVDADLPARFKVSSVFGSARRPSGETNVFGDFTYTTPSYDPNQPYLKVDASVVFGTLAIDVR